ncbi:MAG TPA: cytidine deaminase [Segetibacter sp.]|jgi:cytidine deaminase
MKEEYKFAYEVYDSVDELKVDDAVLLKQAITATKNAYAPYSNFHVSAYARLANGEFVSGTNQENASYPVGMCAERSLLATAATLHSGVAIDTIAITYDNLNGESKHPISPCGMCRQTLLEYESRVKHPIRIILAGIKGKVYIIQSASMLLPLSFTAEDMK